MFECECCGLVRPSTRKYPGIGYWCEDCMNGGCMSDDLDHQSPSHYDDATYDRTNAVHERIGSPRRR